LNISKERPEKGPGKVKKKRKTKTGKTFKFRRNFKKQEASKQA